jgi:16S rRNA (uracil1498-N3)-methyltransferase
MLRADNRWPIILRVLRRIHIPQLRPGDIPLESAQAHHARDVLRLADGTAIEVFDNAGAVARGVLLHLGPREAAVRVTEIDAPTSSSFQWAVAAAVPKGDRADWMVEKLSELGAAALIPLAAARSVVLPQGRSKPERWSRIATESARQSRRKGVMRIEPLTPMEAAIQLAKGSGAAIAAGNETAGASPAPVHAGWFLTTEVPGTPIGQAVAAIPAVAMLTLFVGPEGGWTEAEIAAFEAAGMTAISMGATILRIETAAIAAGAVVASARRA